MMQRKVVVAIDSMKGCLGSIEASEAFADGVRTEFPDTDVAAVAVADGGEGTAAAIAMAKPDVRRIKSRVKGPLGEDIEAEWWLNSKESSAYIDMAAAAGITLISESERNPMRTTSYGVGEIILEALRHHVGHIILGLGGSATVDCGLGACQALGVRFLDADGNEIESPFTGGMLMRVADADMSEVSEELRNVRLSLACDVVAPLTGENGAARVFGPQKGASPEDVGSLEIGLENIRQLTMRKFGIDLNETAGSGAAGGCAGGLMAFAGGKIEKGAPLVLDAIGFDSLIENSDYIVTGEGSADRQTLMGKLPYEILQRGLKSGSPVFLAAGRIKDEAELLDAGFSNLIDINAPDNIGDSNTPGQEAMNPSTASRRLKSAGKTLCRLMKMHK